MIRPIFFALLFSFSLLASNGGPLNVSGSGQYLPLAGGTMTGAINMGTNSIISSGIVTNGVTVHTLVNGESYQPPNNWQDIGFNGSVATQTTTMPTGAIVGQHLTIAQLSGGITSWTLLPSAGSMFFPSPPTTLAAGSWITYMYVTLGPNSYWIQMGIGIGNAGTGNFSGPGSSVAHNLVSFADTTGKLGEDSGIASNAVCTLTGNQVLTNKTLTSPTINTGSFGTSATFSYSTASTVPVFNSSNQLVSSSVTSTTLGFLDATSSIQTQLNAKAPTASPTFTGTITTPVTASTAVISDASQHLAASTTTSTELAFVHGVTSGIQTQINAKAPTASPTFTGTIGTPLTANSNVITDGSGNLASQQTNLIPGVGPNLFLFDDFYVAATNIFGSIGWKTAVTGTGASIGVGVSLQGHPGILQFNTGSTNAGAAILYLGDSTTASLLTDGAIIFEMYINIQNLASGADDYTLRVGMGDIISGATPNNGVYFEYTRATNVNWLAVSRASSSSTSTDTTVAAATGWTKLMWVSNSAGTAIDYYVNGVKKVSAQNTNIPSTGMEVLYGPTKTVGSTNRVFYIDYFRMYQVLTTPRP